MTIFNWVGLVLKRTVGFNSTFRSISFFYFVVLYQQTVTKTHLKPRFTIGSFKEKKWFKKDRELQCKYMTVEADLWAVSIGEIALFGVTWFRKKKDKYLKTVFACLVIPNPSHIVQPPLVHDATECVLKPALHPLA